MCAIALLAMLAVPAGAHGQGTLEPLGSFETFDSLGFSPDGVTYRTKMAHLLIASAGAEVPNETGIFETSLDGEFIKYFPFPSGIDGTLGFSITTATSGPHVGHMFLAAYVGWPSGATVSVIELDEAGALINSFEVAGEAVPGDSITWNHRSQTLALVDPGAEPPLLIEVTPEGEVVRELRINPCVVGITFNIPTGTYFGVCPDGTMSEIDTAGVLLRSFNLGDYGVSQPVGIGSGQGKLFVADEIDVPNSGGIIHIFKSPARAH